MLYIMRHGKTDWNEQYRLQGRTDIPLNEEGIRMAQEAAVKYKEIPFDICFVSPLLRARKTAELLLAGRKVDIVPDDRLQEISFGKYEGTRNVFQHPECPIYNFFQDPTHYRAVDGAESYEELFARTGEFLQERVMPLLAEDKTVLIVGHGAMNNSIISRLRGIPLERFWETAIPNCELIQV